MTDETVVAFRVLDDPDGRFQMDAKCCLKCNNPVYEGSAVLCRACLELAELERVFVAQAEARAAYVVLRLEKPGQEGTFFRLQRVSDCDKTREWVMRESMRGTPVNELGEVLAEHCAAMLTLVALAVPKKDVRGFAREIHKLLAARVTAMLDEHFKRQKAAEQGPAPTVTRMPPRFRVIEGGEEHEHAEANQESPPTQSLEPNEAG